MDYKKSIYNFTYKRSPNENVIYNTFSKALVVLEDAEFARYESLSLEEGEVLDTLVGNGILVSAGEDEAAFLKYFHYRTKFENKVLFLTIAPTLDCNFACPYCYENRRKGKMSQEVQDGILRYLESTIDSGVQELNITWYGGEPLLFFDVVERMSERIYRLAAEKQCALKMDMVTNGYLLTREIVDKLDTLGITKVQITIDGMKAHHDVRRPLRGGEGTFDKIFANLALFEDSPLGILIRMNVDNENAADFRLLKARIAQLHNDNIRVYASPVEDINKDTINSVSDFMTPEEFESFASRACDDGDWTDDDFSVMDDRYCFCTSETENCYVVDDRGDFYKCWDEVGRQEYACFNILRPDEVNYQQIAKFVACDPFSDPKCAGCVFLPLCFGGCKFQRAHLDKSVCAFTEESMIKFIEFSFFSDNN